MVISYKNMNTNQNKCIRELVFPGVACHCHGVPPSIRPEAIPPEQPYPFPKHVPYCPEALEKKIKKEEIEEPEEDEENEERDEDSYDWLEEDGFNEYEERENLHQKYIKVKDEIEELKETQEAIDVKGADLNNQIKKIRCDALKIDYKAEIIREDDLNYKLLNLYDKKKEYEKTDGLSEEERIRLDIKIERCQNKLNDVKLSQKRIREEIVRRETEYELERKKIRKGMEKALQKKRIRELEREIEEEERWKSDSAFINFLKNK